MEENRSNIQPTAQDQAPVRPRGGAHVAKPKPQAEPPKAQGATAAKAKPQAAKAKPGAQPAKQKKGASSKSPEEGIAKKPKKPKRGKLRRVLGSAFYRVYFALVLLCVLGIAFGARYLNGLLADYEAAQPAHVAEEAVRMFEDGDYDAIYDYDTSAQDLAGGREFYVESMRELANGKPVSWSEAYSSDAEERRYSVQLDDEKFAEMTLVPSGEKTGHGNTLWKLGSVTTYVTMAEADEAPEEEVAPEPTPEPAGTLCHITAPTESKVLVDGMMLGAENVSTAEIATASAGMLPEGVPSPTLTEYFFYSESGTPDFQVTDKYGNPQEVTDEGEYRWSCPLPENPELKEMFEKPALEVGEKIAQLAARTLYKGNVLSDCAKGSPAYKSINAFDINSGYKDTRGKFLNTETSNYYQYSEDCFSCHVVFDYKTSSKTYPTTLTLYFIRQGKSGKLYSFTFY